MLRRFASILSLCGILLAIGLHFYAASLYSDATSRDPVNGGYHHFRNYWCDLYAPVTYTSQDNLGRPYALAATLALIATLLCFWFSVTSLFAEYARLALMVRSTGTVAAVAASLIFTPLHDAVITVAAPLGFAAILGTCIGLVCKRQWGLLFLGLAGVTAGFSDYLFWKLAILESVQPTIQKSAFVLIFLWVFVTALKVLASRGIMRSMEAGAITGTTLDQGRAYNETVK